MKLDRKNVVVIGGSSGIGFGVARACLDGGAARVTIVGRTRAKAEAAAARLDRERARAAIADVADEEQVRALFAGGPVDHVVVTAVEARPQPVRALDVAAARRTVDTKLFGALLVAKHARFLEGGSLTLTTGVAAARPGPSGAVIAAVNGALGALVRALALELAPVRVNAVSPGWVDTPVWDVIGDKAERMAAQSRKLPAGRIGEPSDIAEAVLFLMKSAYTTGEELTVDGGHRLV